MKMVLLSTSAFLIVAISSCYLCPVFGQGIPIEGAAKELNWKELRSEAVVRAAQFALQQLNSDRQPAGTNTYVLEKVVVGSKQVSFYLPQSNLQI